MVSLTLTSTMLGAILSTYAITTRRAYDEAIVSRTNEQSRLALDLIGYDLRMTGAGMPLGQGGFAPGGAGLGDAPLPILTTAVDRYESFRHHRFYLHITIRLVRC